MSENNDGFAVPAPRKPAKASNSSSSDPATAESSSSASASKSSQPTPPPLLYTKPNWGAVAQYDYGFEVLKGGVSIDRYKGPHKDFITIGRLPLCDMQMEHPSVSRYHAVVQFNQDGAAFIYDLESAHGTLLNKQRIPPKTHVPLRPGDQLKFGESTRIYIFESDKEQEEESETEIAVRHRSTAADVEHTAEGDDEEEGINWGFREDAPEEPDVDEEATGDASLIDVEAEKKMAEDAKRRRDELDIMYGDESEEEALYDKTGGRKKKKAKKKKKAETYDDLVARKKETEKEIAALEAEIEDRKKKDAAAKAEAAEMGDEGDLDAYMVMLKKQSQTQDLVPIHRLQTKLTQLKKDHERLEKLVKLTKPSDIFGM